MSHICHTHTHTIQICAGGAVRWRVDYHRLSAPGIMLLAPYVPTPDSSSSSSSSAATPQDGVFAVMVREGRSSPRVFAVRGRETMIGHMQQVARKKLGVNIIGECMGVLGCR